MEKRRLGVIKGKLTRVEDYITKLLNQFEINKKLKDEEVAELRLKVEAVKPLLTNFELIQDEIASSSEAAVVDYSEAAEFEERYFKFLARAETLLNQCSPEPIAQDDRSVITRNSGGSQSLFNPSTKFVKLPTINLPNFSGNSEDWLNFKEVFVSLIHEEPTITEVHKLHYLRASLSGKAADVIKNMNLSAASYAIAWDALLERYDNKRILVHTHVKALFNLETITKESSTKLRKLIDGVEKNIRTLEGLVNSDYLKEALLIFLVNSKLDSTTSREFEELYEDSKLPKFDELKAYIKRRAILLETVEQKLGKGSVERSTGSKSFLSTSSICPLCNRSHSMQACDKYMKLDSRQRFEKVKELKLCVNCLQKGHFTKNCSSKYSCKKCRARHHSSLHFESSLMEHCDVPNPTSTDSQAVAENNITAFSSNPTTVLLSTAEVKVFDCHGRAHSARALLDSGSMSSFITSKLAQTLQLDTSPAKLNIRGITGFSSTIEDQCLVTLQSIHNKFTFDACCLIIPTIAEQLPCVPINANNLNIPSKFRLADPNFHKPGEIDILLGASLFYRIHSIGQHRLGSEKPVLQKTKLGWIVSGSLNPNSNSSSSLCNFSQIKEIQDQLSKFWEIEEVSAQRVYSREEKSCEKHFLETHSRDSNGRFIISIPLKESPEILGDSYNTAKRRFHNLEKRLTANPILHDMYCKFMREYQKLGHMHLISPDCQDGYFMPHHGVLQDERITTKLRVVFDASAVTSNGLSFNSIQMVGPTIQSDLISLLLRFRKHRYAICADVEKMYRQVLVEPSQRPLQRILWRERTTDSLQTFELNTVTYGTASAPFQAIRCLTQTAIDFEAIYPEISKVVREDFYVDDLITGAGSLEEAKQICKLLPKVVGSGCFKLRKWISNEPTVLDTIDDTDKHPNILSFGSHVHAKTLGLSWACTTDNLLFSISKPMNNVISKRTILSEMAQIFDPLGLLSPCTIIAKSLLQQLWLEKLSWDEPVSQTISSKWLKFRNELHRLNDLKVPRHILCSKPQKIEMHGFADASCQAYGGCVYLRSTSHTGDVTIRLLVAKSRIAPLKPLTIPRLELCACLILTRLVTQVLRSMQLVFDKIYLWSDSSVVLDWLKTPPNLLKPFVCNRVAEIQEYTQTAIWKHVPTESNPADMLSRGVYPDQLTTSNLWWSGPTWLSENEAPWPNKSFANSKTLELKGQAMTAISIVELSFPFERYSKLSKLERIVAYCLRYISNLRRPIGQRKYETLSYQEIHKSMLTLVEIAQRQSFFAEIEALTQGKDISSKSSILNLNPFLDTNGLLRVGGRLENSTFTFERKHPLVLSHKHRLTQLLFQREHERLFHAGPQLLLANIRLRFWPTRGRDLARNLFRTCKRCFRVSPKQLQPIMGNIPKSRITPSPPFATTGCDYAGPMLLKSKKGRGSSNIKSYICVFVCFNTKAVHLELVSDLSTNAFLMALRRFVSRRGKPQSIHSDNGSNFKGAASTLKELGSFLRKNVNAIPEMAANEQIVWQFIPPSSPHFGGIWESCVKSVKHHLRKVAGNASLTFEEMYTLLVQIEAVLNSRPLCPLSSNPVDLEPLTPSHFLIGQPLMSIPDPDVTEVPMQRLDRYQRVQHLKQHFWVRWSKEYLAELQLRSKWLRGAHTINVEDLVLIKEDNIPPFKWKLGRVIQVHPGKDNIVRVATVKTELGVFKRAVAKLCPLPTDDAAAQPIQ